MTSASNKKSAKLPAWKKTSRRKQHRDTSSEQGRPPTLAYYFLTSYSPHPLNRGIIDLSKLSFNRSGTNPWHSRSPRQNHSAPPASSRSRAPAPATKSAATQSSKSVRNSTGPASFAT